MVQFRPPRTEALECSRYLSGVATTRAGLPCSPRTMSLPSAVRSDPRWNPAGQKKALGPFELFRRPT